MNHVTYWQGIPSQHPVLVKVLELFRQSKDLTLTIEPQVLQNCNCGTGEH